MQGVTERSIVVILRGQPLQLTQQTQPRPEGHLLDRAKVEHCREAVKSQPARVSEKEGRGDERQPTQAPARNHIVNQEPDDKRIEKNENAADDDAKIAAEMQAQKRSHL